MTPARAKAMEMAEILNGMQKAEAMTAVTILAGTLAEYCGVNTPEQREKFIETLAGALRLHFQGCDKVDAIIAADAIDGVLH